MVTRREWKRWLQESNAPHPIACCCWQCQANAPHPIGCCCWQCVLELHAAVAQSAKLYQPARRRPLVTIDRSQQ